MHPSGYNELSQYSRGGGAGIRTPVQNVYRLLQRLQSLFNNIY
jgi:hypothetical protein